MRKHNTFYKIIASALILNMLFTPLLSVRGQATEFTGTLTCQDPSIWLDDHWQFYKVIVEEGNTVIVEVAYEGTLDVDVRLYWKRDNPVGFNGFDVSHCDIDDALYVYKDNSQLRTTNTTALGASETITFTNPSYTLVDDQTAYILVFVYNGTGTSSYTITSTQAITLVTDDETFDCNTQMMLLIMYLGISAVVFIFLSLFIHRKNLKVTGRKKEKKKREEETAAQKKDEEEGGVKHVELDTIVRE